MKKRVTMGKEVIKHVRIQTCMTRYYKGSVGEGSVIYTHTYTWDLIP